MFAVAVQPNVKMWHLQLHCNCNIWQYFCLTLKIAGNKNVFQNATEGSPSTTSDTIQLANCDMLLNVNA